MITGPKKQSEFDIEGKESIKNLKVFEYVAVFNFFKNRFLDFEVFVFVVCGGILIGFESEKCVVVGKSSFVDKKWFNVFLVLGISLTVMVVRLFLFGFNGCFHSRFLGTIIGITV